MRYLLDTSTAIWLFEGNSKLGPATRRLFDETPAAHIFYSTVSLWEVNIKTSIEKISIRSGLEKALIAKDFSPLSITPEHARPIATLNLRHRDPFDRMLIAQAMTENLIIITSDQQILKYPEVTCIDASK